MKVSPTCHGCKRVLIDALRSGGRTPVVSARISPISTRAVTLKLLGSAR